MRLSTGSISSAYCESINRLWITTRSSNWWHNVQSKKKAQSLGKGEREYASFLASIGPVQTPTTIRSLPKSAEACRPPIPRYPEESKIQSQLTGGTKIYVPIFRPKEEPWEGGGGRRGGGQKCRRGPPNRMPEFPLAPPRERVAALRPLCRRHRPFFAVLCFFLSFLSLQLLPL